MIASGARYRRPNVPDLDLFEGKGVWYWASPIEAKFCSGAEVVIVGGGNSAGQAAVFLAASARKVHMLVRGKGLAETMSRYGRLQLSKHEEHGLAACGRASYNHRFCLNTPHSPNAISAINDSAIG